MKNLLLLATLILCNFAYSQINDKSSIKNKYVGIKPKMPDSTQILKTTPQVLLKQKFENVRHHDANQAVDNRNLIKPKFTQALPATTKQ